MSQAIIDFCEGLKNTLLSLEDRLDKAREALESGAAEAGDEAKKHIQEATEQLSAFKAHAGEMAQTLEADLSGDAAGAKEKLKAFGLEAQVALRHAAVFLAGAVAKGAETTAGALQAGAKSARRVAEDLRQDTAVAVVSSANTPPPA